MLNFKVRHVGLFLLLSCCCTLSTFMLLAVKRPQFNNGFLAQSVSVLEANGVVHEYGREAPFIFIGGYPRSGMTLMKNMLDAHSEVRCGDETRMIPRMLQMASIWNRSRVDTKRLVQAGVNTDLIGEATAAFILQVMVRHGDGELAPTPRLCNKDPFIIINGLYLSHLFPKAKIVFVIRDGRATVHSMISQNVLIEGLEVDNYRSNLAKWSELMKLMVAECDQMGRDKCLKVKYESLVSRPREQMELVLSFLGLPWEESVLLDYSSGGVGVASSDIPQSINTEPLTKWGKFIPKWLAKDMGRIAPMLDVLGYNSSLYPA